MYKTKEQFGTQNCQMGLKIVKGKESCLDLTCCSECCNETKIRNNFSPEFCVFPSQYPAYVGFFGIFPLKLSLERNPRSLAQCPSHAPFLLFSRFLRALIIASLSAVIVRHLDRYDGSWLESIWR